MEQRMENGTESGVMYGLQRHKELKLSYNYWESMLMLNMCIYIYTPKP